MFIIIFTTIIKSVNNYKKVINFFKKMRSVQSFTEGDPNPSFKES